MEWIVDRSKEAIGRRWTQQDHQALLSTLKKIDSLVDAIMTRMRCESEAQVVARMLEQYERGDN